MPDMEKVINGLEKEAMACGDYIQLPLWVYSSVLALLKEQKKMMQCIKGKCRICPHCANCDVDENGLMKEQDKLVNVDKLRERLGFAESCAKCKKDSWRCQRDTYFTEMDFCNRLDIAIEELMQEGR